MVPPLWRAYNQLKINVLALPTWRKPVGEGAKRTRGLEVADGLIEDALLENAPLTMRRPGNGCSKIDPLGIHSDVTGGGKLSSSGEPRATYSKSNMLRDFACLLACT
jgi:hypothetical protein